MAGKSKQARAVSDADRDDVTDRLTAKHPHRAALLALRDIIRGVDPAVTESVKWNAPSFATTEHFATMQLRHVNGAQLVLHLGVKSRADARVRQEVQDPEGLLEWRSADRALVTFRDREDVEAKRRAFTAIVRQWIGSLEAGAR